MEHEELIKTIMKTEAENGLDPLQLHVEPKKVNL